jgi:hypothetical protein
MFKLNFTFCENILAMRGEVVVGDLRVLGSQFEVMSVEFFGRENGFLVRTVLHPQVFEVVP